MATKFQEVYGYFLSQIDDLDLQKLSRETFDEVLKKYMLNGLLHVQEANTDFMDVDVENEQFNNDLQFAEMLLVAKAMKLSWASEKRYSEELMRKAIGDRDYKAVQGTDYLKELGDMESQLRKEIREDVMRHAYSNRENWGELLNG